MTSGDHKAFETSDLAPEKKGLLFIETSALDSTNVEAAFSEVLSGSSVCCQIYSPTRRAL